MPLPLGLEDALETTDFFLNGTVETVVEPHREFLQFLLDRKILLPEEWDELDSTVQTALMSLGKPEEFVDGLVQRHLLTKYQAEMIRTNSEKSLMLGHYRILEPLGQGGMGTIYRAENIFLRREVAIKVISTGVGVCARTSKRFYSEARAIARLQHPNIISCLDAGHHTSAKDSNSPSRDYFVMELVRGRDLDALVRESGPIPAQRVCELFRQIADALAEAHRIGLIHRDLKPSNIMVTADWQVKLLDFGLALQPQQRMTEPGCLLGTIGYMSPEQARAPHTVDGRADIFSLGATMYWALTAKEPFPSSDDPIQDLQDRVRTRSLSIKTVRPELPDELADLVDRMLHPDCDQRPPSARVVALTLAGLARVAPARRQETAAEKAASAIKPTILAVDDDASLRKLIRAFLGQDAIVLEAQDGDKMLAICDQQNIDIIILDVNLPGKCGDDLLKLLEGRYPETERPYILLTSGVIPPESLGGLKAIGADDFLPKPFSRADFRSRVFALLKRKNSSPQKEGAVEAPKDSNGTISSKIASLAPLVSVVKKGSDSRIRVEALSNILGTILQDSLGIMPGYAQRLGRYIRAIAARVPDNGEYSRLKDDRLLDMLDLAAPLHDIGMLAIPNTMLLKVAELNKQEQIIVQTHTVVGANWLLSANREGSFCDPSIQLAAEIARYHHEFWDGTGYPDGLVGADIPLSARLVGLVSVYDALRSRRAFRPGLTHAKAVRMISQDSVGQYDPILIAAFLEASQRFDQINQNRS